MARTHRSSTLDMPPAARVCRVTLSHLENGKEEQRNEVSLEQCGAINMEQQVTLKKERNFYSPVNLA